tara:strand:+ start:784 stop:1374 length:591 start_codon:yes stop_codon:yes gene_type:complete
MFNKIFYKARPRKLFLYYKIQEFLKDKNFLNIIDLGCGDGSLRKIVNFKHYDGIDIDPQSIEKTKKDAKKNENFFLGDIKNFLFKKKYDLTLCIQLIGFNKNFNISDLDEIILQMNKCTQNNGYLIFNIGSKIIDENDTIEKRISTNFEIINKITYGNFKKKRNFLIAKFILILQIYFDNLKKGPSENILYICKKK